MHVVAVARTRRASLDMLRAVFQSSLLKKVVAYHGVLAGWSLEDSMRLENILAGQYRRHTKDRLTAQAGNMVWGLGFFRLSSAIQA